MCVGTERDHFCLLACVQHSFTKDKVWEVSLGPRGPGWGHCWEAYILSVRKRVGSSRNFPNNSSDLGDYSSLRIFFSFFREGKNSGACQRAVTGKQRFITCSGF